MAKKIVKVMKSTALNASELTLSKKPAVSVAEEAANSANEKYPYAEGDSVVVFDSTPVGRRDTRSPMGEGNWRGLDIGRQVIKILIDNAIKEFPYGTEVEYLR